MQAKSNLPTKICVVCEKPFTWRRKGSRVWAKVKYCSSRCRTRRYLERNATS